MEPINVLDHGFVRLVSFMQPASDDNYGDWTGDLEVVRNARVSYGAAARAGEDEGSDTRLIDYLLRNRHTSPFESMVFTFEVKAPIFVLRQWHRHRTWSYNEVSARYKELPEEFYVPELAHITTQSANNKQMRTDEVHPQAAWMCDQIATACEDAFRVYKEMIAKGCPRELARSVLPVATYSHMFATVDLHNLLHFCALRMHSHAQYEIRVYAEAMLDLVQPIVPAAVKAFKVHTLKEPLAVVESVGRTVTAIAKSIRKHF